MAEQVPRIFKKIERQFGRAAFAVGGARRAQTLDFDLAIDKAAEIFGIAFDRAFKAVALDAFERVIRRTPVGDADYWEGHPKGNPPGNRTPPPGYIGGNARNNWWLSVNAVNDTANGRQPNATADAATNGITAGVLEAELGDVLHIQNGVPYILRLESGELSPRQAPHGMVAVTFAELQTHFQAMLDKEVEK